MKKISLYQCEYCKCKTRNLKKLEKHELRCKELSLIQTVAKSRIFALLHNYEKQGYKISINYSTDCQSFVTVYHPDYGKFK